MTETEVVALRFDTTHEAADILSFWLLEAGALGVSVVDPEEIRQDLARPDSLNYAGSDFLDSLPDAVELTAWFYRSGDRLLLQAEGGRDNAMYPKQAPVTVLTDDFVDDISARLADLHDRLPSDEDCASLGFISLDIVLPESWADNWKQYAVPLYIGRRTVVTPSWREADLLLNERDIIIRIDPGMAFGTGSHETTSQCLALLEGAITPGDRVIDVGTGSGLLAIAAKKLGAAHVLALDVDPVAVRTAAENAAANDVSIETRTGSLEPGTAEADVVVANIIFDVLVGLKHELSSAVRPGGRLIASGVLTNRAAAFIAEMTSAGFLLQTEQSDRDWAAFMFVREAAS